MDRPDYGTAVRLYRCYCAERDRMLTWLAGLAARKE